MSEKSRCIIKRMTDKRVEMVGNGELPALAGESLPTKPITLDVTLSLSGCDGEFDALSGNRSCAGGNGVAYEFACG